MRALSFFLIGVLFAAGLGISGMTQPLIVLAFLDVFGNWNPALAFVMGGAVAVTFVGYRFVLGRQRPLLGAGFDLPTRSTIDAQLVAGAALFGLGWGLAGFCPGPALTALASGSLDVFVFVVAMFAGFLARDAFVRPAATQAPGGDAQPAA